MKIDLSKYFYSIHHNILISLIHKKIKNPYIFKILVILIRSYETPNIFDNIFKEGSVYFLTRQKGMPIGSLTSQIFANIMFNPLDHLVKQTLKVKYHIRYVDDMVFFLNSKELAFLILDELSCYCLNILKIEINPKKVMIFPSESKPLDFLGYRISKYKILPRKKLNVK